MTGTTTTGARAPRWLHAALAVGVAALLAVALLAGSTGHAAAEEADAAPDSVTDEASAELASDALVTGGDAWLAPAMAVLSRLVEGGQLPADASDALQRVLDRLHDRAPQPGAVCRRAANADQAPDSILERCRDFVSDRGDRGDRDPLAVCRRAANADQAPDSILERCRDFASDRGDQGNRDPLAVCRRAANADQAPDSILERCRDFASDRGDQGNRDPLAVCRRAANADQAPDSILERCRDAVGGGERLDRPERPDVRPAARPNVRPDARPQVRPDRARLLGPPSIAPRAVTAASAPLS